MEHPAAAQPRASSAGPQLQDSARQTAGSPVLMKSPFQDVALSTAPAAVAAEAGGEQRQRQQPAPPDTTAAAAEQQQQQQHAVAAAAGQQQQPAAGAPTDGQHSASRPESPPGIKSADSEAPLLPAAVEDPAQPEPLGGSPKPALKSGMKTARFGLARQQTEASGETDASRMVSWRDEHLVSVREYEASEHSEGGSHAGSSHSKGGCCSIQ